jgi:hypothetical protein
MNPGKRTLKLIIYGEKLTDSLSKDIVARRVNYGLEESEIVIERTLDTSQKMLSSPEFKPAENIELERQLIEKDEKITILTTKLAQYQQRVLNDTALFKEFTALFGKPEELLITNAQVMEETDKVDTVTFVYYSINRKAKRIDANQLERWLKERTNSKRIKIIRQ